MFQLYNSLTRRKEPFAPADGETVTMYTCGPTVYDYAHVGNMRSFLLYDLLHRVLKHEGWKVAHVWNVTDVDDKIIGAALERGVSVQEQAAPFEQAFFEDLATLNIDVSEVQFPRATECIPDMVRLVERLIERGHAYEKDGSVYFDISSFKGYGKLSGVEAQSGARRREFGRLDQDTYDKDDVQDFALWKARKEGEPGWESPWGLGRPGWHIECSAMTLKLLGETIDLHAGGVDLLFPHHENEIAQSEAATGKPFVRFWVHGEHLLVEGQKMSKSLGNFYTIRDLLEQGYSPPAIRLALMGAHYRRQLNFTQEGLRRAEQTLRGVRDFVHRVRQTTSKVPDERLAEAVAEAREKFEAALDDDLNIPGATAQVFELQKAADIALAQGRVTRAQAEEVEGTLEEFDRVLGLQLVPAVEILDEDVERLIEERQAARAERDFARADAIRDELAAQGIVLEDTPAGVRWRRGE